eukprot:scaffold4422_cov110-Skeletonema_dohrnii-CCMP3373.AAC.4
MQPFRSRQTSKILLFWWYDSLNSRLDFKRETKSADANSSEANPKENEANPAFFYETVYLIPFMFTATYVGKQTIERYQFNQTRLRFVICASSAQEASTQKCNDVQQVKNISNELLTMTKPTRSVRFAATSQLILFPKDDRIDRNHRNNRSSRGHSWYSMCKVAERSDG